MEQRIEKIEQRLDTLEKQEREYSFTIRDIAHKTTMALGILTAQESDIKEIKATMATKDDVTDIKAVLAEILQRLPKTGGDDHE